MKDQSRGLPDRSDAAFAIVSPVIRPFDRIIIENQRGQIKTKSAFPPVPLVFGWVPIETHDNSYANSVENSSSGWGGMCDAG